MANRERGESWIVADGTAYTLVLSIDVMTSLEDYFSTTTNNVAWVEIWSRVLNGSKKTIRALIWSMLRPHHPNLTFAEANELIDKAGGLAKLTHIIDQAGRSSTPDPADVKELSVKSNEGSGDTHASWDWRGLYLHARRIGLSADDFWGITIRGLFREFAAANQRRTDEHDRDAALAWLIAALERQKTLPKLETILARRSRRQTAAEQKGMLHLLSAQYGIPLQKTSRRTH